MITACASAGDPGDGVDDEEDAFVRQRMDGGIIRFTFPFLFPMTYIIGGFRIKLKNAIWTSN